MNATSDTSAIGLSPLLAPLELAHFFAEYWQQNSLLAEISSAAFEDILDEIGPLEISGATELATEGCQAWLSNRYIEHSVFPCGVSDAAEFYDAGATLYFLNIRMPRLTGAIADSLGVPRHRVIASLFLTPPHSGAALHFDKNENFTVQLTGKKRWTIGERPALRNAPQSHVWGREFTRDLAPLQAEVIDSARHWVELTARSLLYVPRGMVHGTQADEASWSLNISYTGFMWVDLVCDRLRNALLKMPQWRESVIGIGPASDPQARRKNRLFSLMEELRDILGPELIADLETDDHARPPAN